MSTLPLRQLTESHELADVDPSDALAELTEEQQQQLLDVGEALTTIFGRAATPDLWAAVAEKTGQKLVHRNKITIRRKRG